MSKRRSLHDVFLAFPPSSIQVRDGMQRVSFCKSATRDRFSVLCWLPSFIVSATCGGIERKWLSWREEKNRRKIHTPVAAGCGEARFGCGEPCHGKRSGVERTRIRMRVLGVSNSNPNEEPKTWGSFVGHTGTRSVWAPDADFCDCAAAGSSCAIRPLLSIGPGGCALQTSPVYTRDS